MPCYGPLTGYFGKERHPVTGRRSLVFNKNDAFSGVPVVVPCGQCIGCRLERSRQWAMRCMHEKRMHAASAFLTMTYSPEKLPALGTLRKRDLQLFMKRLRKVRPSGLRFFACGEYGETTGRPHYHVLLFNTCFPDMRFWKETRAGFQLFASAELNGLWSNGDCLIGNVDFESCAYVARYCTKVITGEKAEAHYAGREKEFTVMSRRPGIGFAYYEKYGAEAYKHDTVVVNGYEVGLPRYYDSKYELVDRAGLDALKVERRRRAKLRKADQTSARRKVIERFEYLKAETFKRKDI